MNNLKKAFLVFCFIVVAIPLDVHAATIGSVLATYSLPSAVGTAVFDPSTSSMWLPHRPFSPGTALTKMRAIDGAILGKYYSTSELIVRGLDFDSSTNSIWIAVSNDWNVVNARKIRASDGVQLGMSLIGSGVYGEDICGAIFDPSTNSVLVGKSVLNIPSLSPLVKVRASDGVITGSYVTPGGRQCAGIFNPVTDSMWIVGAKSVINFRFSDGVILGTYDLSSYLSSSEFPLNIVFDSSTNSIWVGTSNSTNGKLIKLSASDGAVLGVYPIGSTFAIVGLAFDPVSNSIWAVSLNGNWGIGPSVLVRVRTSDGAILGTYPSNFAASGPTFDPISSAIWVASSPSLSSTAGLITKYATGSLSSGTIDISSNLPTASWTLLGPSGVDMGSGLIASYPGKPAGMYTIVWGAVPGYLAPLPQTLSIVNNGDALSFVGTYTSLAPVGPSVDLKVNGSDSPTIAGGTTVPVSWISSGASCEITSGYNWAGANNARAASGSDDVTIGVSGDYSIRCADASGTTGSDTVHVNAVCTPTTGAWGSCDCKTETKTRTNINASCGSWTESDACTATEKNSCRDFNWKEVAP